MATATRKVRSAVPDAGNSGRLSRERRMRLVVSGNKSGASHWNIISSSGVKLASLGRREAHDRGERAARRVCRAAASARFQVDAPETPPTVAA